MDLSDVARKRWGQTGREDWRDEDKNIKIKTPLGFMDYRPVGDYAVRGHGPRFWIHRPGSVLRYSLCSYCK